MFFYLWCTEDKYLAKKLATYDASYFDDFDIVNTPLTKRFYPRYKGHWYLMRTCTNEITLVGDIVAGLHGKSINTAKMIIVEYQELKGIKNKIIKIN